MSETTSSGPASVVTCQFIQDCPQFQGIDGAIYPPEEGSFFSSGDIATLPVQHADLLTSKGVVEILQEPQPETIPTIANDEFDEPEQRISIDAPGALTEIGNSIQFVNQFKDRCKFSFDGKRWYVWDNGQRWKPNHIGKVKRWAKTIVKRLYSLAGNINDDGFRARVLKHAEKSNTRAGVANLLDLASSDLECSDLDFDKDGYLLNCQNFTIDLRTGESHSHSQKDMISKISGVNYNPNAICPIWEAHISKIFDENKELILNFQEICGYGLAGIGNPSAIFPILYGRGRNGKTVCLNVLTHIMGDYAVSIAPQSLQPIKPGVIRSDLMPIRGARVITCTEPGKGMMLDDGVIKAATGGDKINARHLYGLPEEFRMSGCIFLATNNKPKVRDQSAGMWDRVWMIPFNHYFDPTSPDTDPYMEQKLMKEGSGILNWFIIGWKRYQVTGKLVKCKLILDETTEYQNSEDFLYDFLYQKKENGDPVFKIDKRNKNIEIRFAELYTAYQQWCTLPDVDVKAMSRQAFGRVIGDRFEKSHDMKGAVYLGITLAKTPIQAKVTEGE